MPYLTKMFLTRCLWVLISINMNICFSYAAADDSRLDSKIHGKQIENKTGIAVEIGVLVFLGPDVRVSYHQPETPFIFGFRYLDIKDDFINESAAGFPSDESDKMYTKRTGFYLDYLFNSLPNTASYYVSGALYKTTEKLKCYSESDTDSATSLYFGGGYRGYFSNQFGYKIGLLMSPFVNLKQTTSYCSNDESGDIDIDVSLTYTF